MPLSLVGIECERTAKLRLRLFPAARLVEFMRPLNMLFCVNPVVHSSIIMLMPLPTLTTAPKTSTSGRERDLFLPILPSSIEHSPGRS